MCWTAAERKRVSLAASFPVAGGSGHGRAEQPFGRAGRAGGHSQRRQRAGHGTRTGAGQRPQPKRAVSARPQSGFLTATPCWIPRDGKTGRGLRPGFSARGSRGGSVMLGAAGAAFVHGAGHGLGRGAEGAALRRLRLLENEVELLARLRLMILEERLGLPALLRACAADGGEGLLPGRLEKQPSFWKSTRWPVCGRPIVRPFPPCRFQRKSRRKRPSWTRFSPNWERAPPPCGNRRRPAPSESCGPFRIRRREQAEKGGKLLMQLGLLFGLMAGIALW